MKAAFLILLVPLALMQMHCGETRKLSHSDREMVMDTLSYALGMALAQNAQLNGAEISLDAMLEGYRAGKEGKFILTEEMVRNYLRQFGQKTVRASIPSPPYSQCQCLPNQPKTIPVGGGPYYPAQDFSNGQHLALSLHKLTHGFHPQRPFRIWAIGSSYTNALGNGEVWQEVIPRQFPNAPEIEYTRMVGSGTSWQYVRAWLNQFILHEQPDLILCYATGDPEDLENLIRDVQKNTTAEIIIPSIHWRERDAPFWGKSENAMDQDIGKVREICRKYGVEFVENRRDWGAYLSQYGLPISSLLTDDVHQNAFGTHIILSNILSHFCNPPIAGFVPDTRERRIMAPEPQGGVIRLAFTGNRIDLIGRKSPQGGEAEIFIDGIPANQFPAYTMTYIHPTSSNQGSPATATRDQAPHGVLLGQNIIPQYWTLRMTSPTGDFELEGSVTGFDGKGNAFQPFTSNSGQILLDPSWWRFAEKNRTGDLFSWEVMQAGQDKLSFRGPKDEVFSSRLVQSLPNTAHTLEIRVQGEATIDAFQVFTPPLR